MNKKEKVQAYNTLLTHLKNWYKSETDSNIKDQLIFVCPELTECEDENIRKSLIGHLKECRNNTRSEVMIYEYAKWIAWLEKQKDQKTEIII